VSGLLAYVSGARLQFAMRELRALFSRPIVWAVLMGASVVLAIAGAFGTGDALAFVPRLFYWTLLVSVTGAVGTYVNALFRWQRDQAPLWGVSVTSGVAITLTVTLINHLIFSSIFDGSLSWLTFLASAFASACIVSGVIEVLFRKRMQEPEPPPLTDRLPLELRGALIALSVEDHYVRVRTTKGTHMLLMRLSDAIRETAPVVGLQVHRSHWVAIEAVRQVARKGDGALLTLSDGSEIPVSRSNMGKLKEAGLLPK